MATAEALNAALTSDSFNVSAVNERAFALISETVLPTLPQELQDAINAQPTVQEKILASLQIPTIEEDAALYTMQQIAIAYTTGYLPPDTLPATLTTPLPAAPVPPAPTPATAEETTAEPVVETTEPPEETTDLRTQLADAARVRLVEMAYARALESERIVPESDGFYDTDVRNFVRDNVQSLFDEYGPRPLSN